MFNPAILKIAASLVVGSCASRQVGLLIRANSPATVTTFQKVTTAVAAYGLGSAASQAAVRAFEKDLSDAQEIVTEFKKIQHQTQA